MNDLTKLALIIITLFSMNCISQTYPIVDTDVSDYYDNSSIITSPPSGQAFYGQDAHYNGNQPSYTDNGDGTITDNITGLMWEQDMGTKITYDAAFVKAENSSLGGYSDWRVPTIKELYSLAQFTGRCYGDYAVDMFIDTNYFNQPVGDTTIVNVREIDAQTWSSTQYIGITMANDTSVFGYNFVDGRLKSYPKYEPGPTPGAAKSMYFRMVRGNTTYGINDFLDNSDGTITDNATGLMWQQADDGITRDWENSLFYCENLSLAGNSDWRLPNAKELHSILDYTRAPIITNSPSIDPLFTCSSFNNPDGNSNYGYYWTSSPLMDGPTPYTDAVYICFGEAQGQMSLPPLNVPTIYDTHGAGAQRNDPKVIGANTYPAYFGPQGDILYVNNYVRAVRDVNPATSINENEEFQFKIYPNPAKNQIVISSQKRMKSIVIYNTIGEEVISLLVDSNSVTVNTCQLASGIYYVTSFSKDEVLKAKKVIINN